MLGRVNPALGCVFQESCLENPLGLRATTVSQELNKWDDPLMDKESPSSLLPTAQKTHGLMMYSGIKSIFPCLLGCGVVQEHSQQP